MKAKAWRDPYVLVSEALGCSSQTLTIESGLNRHPDWDSFGQLNVLLAMEEEYALPLNDDTVVRYSNMRAIIEYYEGML